MSIIPHTQIFRHDPDNGVYGDCWRATVACLLRMPVEAVPHVCDGPDDGKASERMRAFLESQDCALIQVPFSGDMSLQQILEYVGAISVSGGLHWCLMGTSRTGCNHVVICKGSEIIHDPSITQSGIVGPASDGLWWVEWVVQRTACDSPSPSPNLVVLATDLITDRPANECDLENPSILPSLKLDPERHGNGRGSSVEPHGQSSAAAMDIVAETASPQQHVEGDNQPRYTTKRLHDEIAKAKALARIEILDQLHSKALAQVEYFDRKQREFICLEDCHDEDGELHLPDSIEPLLRHDHANGRMSEAAWWRDTIQQLKEEGDPARQTNVTAIPEGK